MVVAHKILLSAPVPWIGDLGIWDQGLTIIVKHLLREHLGALQRAPQRALVIQKYNSAENLVSRSARLGISKWLLYTATEKWTLS